MSVVLAVDEEQLLIDFLRGHADVAAIIDGRIGKQLPKAYVSPRIRLSRLGGPRLQRRFDQPRVQIECYGNDDGEAKDLTSTARAALESIVGVHALGVVTSVDEYLGPQWSPDNAGGPGTTPTPRYLFAVQLTTHPNT